MGIGRHGFGVRDKTVPIEHSHGLTADGKTVPPFLKTAMALAISRSQRPQAVGGFMVGMGFAAFAKGVTTILRTRKTKRV